MDPRKSINIDSLSRFHKSVFFIYNVLGVSPPTLNGPGPVPKLEICNAFGYLFVIVVYWIGIGWSITIRGWKDSQVSIISNLIQLLLNALAFTVAAVNPIFKYKTYSKIISRFNKINGQLAFEPKKPRRIFKLITTSFFLALVFNCAFSFYVSVLRAGLSAPYWILYSMPLFIYATSLHQAIFFIFSVHERLEVGGQLLMRTKKNSARRFPDHGSAKCSQTVLVSPCVCPPNLMSACDKTCVEKGSADKCCQLINETYLLSVNIEHYCGPVILVSLGALFVVTSVQAFHAYEIVSDLNPTKNRTIWTLISCVNIIIINMGLVFGLCSVSEMVYQDVDRILGGIIREKHTDQSSVNEFSNWLDRLLSRIKFTALGFFNINYNMLFGFFSTIITYLIILIQFDSLGGGGKSSSERPFGHDSLTYVPSQSAAAD